MRHTAAIENLPFVMPITDSSHLFSTASNSSFRVSIPVAEQMRELNAGIDLSPEITFRELVLNEGINLSSKTIFSGFVLIAEQIGEQYERINLSPEVTLDDILESNEQSRETQDFDPLLGLKGILEREVADINNTMPEEMRQIDAGLADADRAARMAYAEAQARQLCAHRGLDWDAMSEVEREDFVNDLIHEDRECSS